MNTTIKNTMNSFAEITENCKTTIKHHEDVLAGKVEDVMWAYNAPTACIKAIAEYGAENIFMTMRDYHGRYEEDDCNFGYYNNITGEFFTDSWTTAFACPNFSLYECISFAEAWENGMVNKEKFFEAVKNDILKWISNSNPIININTAVLGKLKCTVTKGRKWKGTGYVIDSFEKSYRFYTPMFRTTRADYGVTETTIAVVYCPDDNTIHEVNADYLEYDNKDQLIEDWRKEATELVEKSTIENLEVITGYTKTERTINVPYHFPEFILKHANTIDTSTASYPERDEKIKKAEEFKVKKMEELIEWVKSNTDKTGEEINKLAEHIYEKRYGSR